MFSADTAKNSKHNHNLLFILYKSEAAISTIAFILHETNQWFTNVQWITNAQDFADVIEQKVYRSMQQFSVISNVGSYCDFLA